MQSICFLFPVHNESDRILKVKSFLDWVNKKFSKINYKFIFLLNDCSDNTENLIKENFKNYPYEVLKSRLKYRGAGLNLAFKKYKKMTKYFAICSVDNAWEFNFYINAFNKIKKSDDWIIYGPKSHINSKVKTNISRKIISRISRIYLRILFGSFMNQDTQCIKLFKSNIGFLNKLHSYNYFAETEFYLMSKLKKLEYSNMPVKVKNDNRNSKINIRGILYYMIECLHFRFNYFNK